ncbi:MAG: hypothetical protein R2728_03090 [Chitinophagales bacterium]
MKTKKEVTINFAGSTNMYINLKIKIDKSDVFNLSGETVTMYVDKVDVKEAVVFNGNIYSTKDIHVHGGNDSDSEDDDSYNNEKTTYMTGLFIFGRKNT